MGCQAVLFDLDGTLLDTLEDLADSVNAVLRRLGFPEHPAEAYKYFVGQGFPVLAERALPPGERSPARIAECVAQAKAEYGRRWSRLTRPYPGIPPLLDELAGRGVRLAILSNKPHEFTVEMVRHFLPRWRFEAVLGGRAGVPAKPDPTTSLEVCARLGLPPARVAYVGDSGTDMQTARRAGMYAVGVLWGFREREELLADGAQVLIERPAGLLPLLGGPGGT